MSLLQSNGREAELLALATHIEAGNHLGWEQRAKLSDFLRFAALPSPVDNPSREEIADVVRLHCRQLGNAVLQMSHGVERIYYTGISVNDLAETIRSRLAANPPDPDSMNDKRALQDMKPASNVREATIRECAEKSGDDGVRELLNSAAIFLAIGARYAPNETIFDTNAVTGELFKARGLADIMRAVAENCNAHLSPPLTQDKPK